MRYIALIPTFIDAFILQLTLLNLFTINGIVPSLLLCLVLVITYLYDEEFRTIICGTVAGLFLDFTVGHYTGIYALTFLLIGCATVGYKYFANSESKRSLIPLCAGGVILYHGIPSGILAFLGSSVSISRVIGFLPLSMAYNFVIMLIMYIVLIRNVNKRPQRSRYERYEII